MKLCFSHWGKNKGWERPGMGLWENMSALEGWRNKVENKTTWKGALRSVLLIKYYSGDQTSKNEICGVYSTYGEEERFREILMGKIWSKEPLGRATCREENNIKRDLAEMGCEGVDWIDVTGLMWLDWCDLTYVTGLMWLDRCDWTDETGLMWLDWCDWTEVIGLMWLDWCD